MIVLRSPKGWTGPKEVDGHKVEGSWRAHQVPVADPATNKKDLKIVEDWMRSYKPEELFDANGTLIPELQELAPSGPRRISANPHANGGLLRKELELPDFRDYAVEVKAPGATYAPPTDVLAHFLAEVMRRNMNSFRVFGPDETASNRLTAIYAASKKTWLAEFKPEDADGGELDVAGRVMEMLSEHTLEGWFEGYVLTGRHGFFSSYEAFIHIIDSMFNQHAKWLEKSKKELAWRAPVPSINLLITSLVWRQDHNGFTHQDPGFLDVVTNKSPDVVRIYLPPDANCLLSVTDHCLRSRDYVNVIVADKQEHLQYLTMEDAVTHCTKGIGIWDWASTDDGEDPDVVMACAGDIADHGVSCGSRNSERALPRFENSICERRGSFPPHAGRPNIRTGSPTAISIRSSPLTSPSSSTSIPTPRSFTNSVTGERITTTFMCADTRKKATSILRSNLRLSIRSTASIWRLMSSTAFRACAPSALTSRNG